MRKAITPWSKNYYRKERAQSAQVRGFSGKFVCFSSNLLLALSNSSNTKGWGRTTCHHTPGNEIWNRPREVFRLVTPFVMMWCDMCSSFQFYGIFSLLDRHYSPLWQLKPADACNCDFSRFSWSGCKKRILILFENYLAGIYFNIT